ncbi:hypothetical protein OP10G_1833 [Fimbriimonas ginsengisoli Gsoil 348]|uniref:Transposase n=1 Tax=Fimbriimonas ginsengisoli Gsoil 348 TaxID=661478 RepID=A0A068NP35_FIMGI|nr:hypothetical protein OP10G_1833 [Fimbriimonas ginsengisoli Gsoil 348]
MVRPNADIDLSEVVQQWKSVTAHRINEALCRRGPVWQKESFDHIVRTQTDLERFVGYTLANPHKGNLAEKARCGSAPFPLDGVPWLGMPE